MGIVEAEDVVAGYGENQILHGVSMTVDEGEITTIVGPNGAGKSTLLKAISGIVTPWDGTVWFRGEDVTELGPKRKLEEGIAIVPQGRSVFSDMTVIENLKLGAILNYERAYIERNLSRVFEVFGDLEALEGKKAKQLSGGQQQMVELGRAMMMEPDVLLVDEPSAGLAPNLVSDVLDHLRRLREEAGLTIVIVEQNVEAALSVSDSGYVLADGKNVFSGSAEDVLSNERLGELYLGKADAG